MTVEGEAIEIFHFAKKDRTEFKVNGVKLSYPSEHLGIRSGDVVRATYRAPQEQEERARTTFVQRLSGTEVCETYSIDWIPESER